MLPIIRVLPINLHFFICCKVILPRMDREQFRPIPFVLSVPHGKLDTYTKLSHNKHINGYVANSHSFLEEGIKIVLKLLVGCQ